jgi:predicted CopG family antitoxin
MGTTTIGLDDEAYERLEAQKREGESFSDTVTRITEAMASDWREGFGRLDDDTADRIAAVVAESRESTGRGLADRQRRALEAMADEE